jgi:hypothetical protein
MGLADLSDEIAVFSGLDCSHRNWPEVLSFDFSNLSVGVLALFSRICL